MVHFWDNWLFELKRKKIRDQQGLWVNSFFRQMSFALMHVFSVVFVFSLGREKFLMGGIQGGLLLLLVYLILIRLTVMLAVIPLSNNVIRRIGYRRSILSSLFFTSLSFLVLSLVSITKSLWLLSVAPIALGIGVCLYWVTYFTLFSDEAKKASIGRSFGIMDVFAKLGQVTAPLMGAIIVLLLGYDILFLVGVVLLLISGIPMFFLKHHLHLDAVSWKEFGKWEKERRFKLAGLSMGGRLLEEIMIENLWPIYVFLIVGSLEKLGVFRSILLLATAVFTYLVSRLFDRSHNKKYQIISVIGGSLLWVVRLGVTTLPQILVIDSVDKFFSATTRTFFFGSLFLRAKGSQSFSFIVYWIVWESFWAIAGLGILALLLLISGVEIFWMGMVLVGILGLVLSLFLKDHK